jgi:hypothetical protein
MGLSPQWLHLEGKRLRPTASCSEGATSLPNFPAVKVDPDVLSCHSGLLLRLPEEGPP